MVLGGSKVSDKLGVIENLLDKADRLVIGGGMVFTFLKAKGYEVGTSLLEEDQIDKVKGYIETAEKNSSPTAHVPWPRRSSTRPRTARSRSSAAVIPRQPCVTSASRRMASRTSPPAAVLPSSSLRARSFPA